MPSLINKTQNQEYVSKLKKTYSTLAQATNMIIAEEGSPKNNWANSDENVYNLYKKHMINIKECANEEGCFKQIQNIGYKLLSGNGRSGDFNSAQYWKFILQDGVQVIFLGTDISCNNNGANSIKYCTKIWVDLNGEKKPNTIGRDAFAFMLTEKGLYPYGFGNTENCINSAGDGCTAKVLKEGAMNY